MNARWYRKAAQYSLTDEPTEIKAHAGRYGIPRVRVNANGSTAKGLWGGDDFTESYEMGLLDIQPEAPFAYAMRGLDLVVVDIDGKNDGWTVAADLDLPPTLSETSKSGNGVHLWYSVPAGTPARDRIGYPRVGVDIKGVGIVYHHDSQRWNALPVAPAPAWVLESLANAPDAPQGPRLDLVGATATATAPDWFADVLASVGDLHNGVLMPLLQMVEARCLSRSEFQGAVLGYVRDAYVAGGDPEWSKDYDRAVDNYRATGSSPEEDFGPPEKDDEERSPRTGPELTLLADAEDEDVREPDIGVIYSRRINIVFGSHTAGKTWISLWHAAEAIPLGRTLYIDYEDNAASFKRRARPLDERLLRNVFHYRPNGPVDWTSVARLVRQHDIALVVVDTVGEALAAAGLDYIDATDVATWLAKVRPVAELGPAVLLLDHVAKTQDGKASPVGSFRKTAGIDGAAFHFVNKSGFSKERAGWSVLTATKDRNGTFATDEVVARVDFEPDGSGGLAVTVSREAAESEEQALVRKEMTLREVIMREVRRWEDEEDPGVNSATGNSNSPALGANVGTIKRYLRSADVKFKDKAAEQEIRWLVQGGYLSEVVRGQGHFHRVRKPYYPEFEDD
ncbi:MAG: AAA family ATPase [Cellulomonas sp.]